MEIEFVLPNEIEKRSFEIIGKELEAMGISLDPKTELVTKRVIHTSADFEYAKTMRYSKSAVEIARDLIRGGAHIVTDTNMALSGINKKRLELFGGKCHCFMADEDVALEAKERKVTRATVSMERAASLGYPTIFALGNAPTALISLYEMMEKGIYTPDFVIGVPVGFVNVVAAKELFLNSDVPFIINEGRKGGSNVAAAIVNALLYGMEIPESPSVKTSYIAGTGKEAKRKGFTTGSCAAAAAKAAAFMLFSGKEKKEISIETPAGIMFNASLVDINRAEDRVSCAVIKDGGDDPDVTTGCHVVAEVLAKPGDFEVEILGGKGVGKVTRPGLDQPVGEAAINHVPRAMIIKEVTEVAKFFDVSSRIIVKISIPEGEELARHTFNPRLGIEKGISVLGTTGIVEPMSAKALVDTIRVELNQKKAEGERVAKVSPGNYGLKFMREHFDYDLDTSVKCSNFVGETIDMCAEMGFEKLLITGHIGKLIKLAAGIMNTHSHEADGRMEILSSFAILAGGDVELARKILGCLNTEEALKYIKEADLLDKVMMLAMEKILYYMNFRAEGRIKLECILYSNEFGLLAMSDGAKLALKE